MIRAIVPDGKFCAPAGAAASAGAAKAAASSPRRVVPFLIVLSPSVRRGASGRR
jgi:hypothetical protein